MPQVPANNVPGKLFCQQLHAWDVVFFFQAHPPSPGGARGLSIYLETLKADRPQERSKGALVKKKCGDPRADAADEPLEALAER